MVQNEAQSKLQHHLSKLIVLRFIFIMAVSKNLLELRHVPKNAPRTKARLSLQHRVPRSKLSNFQGRTILGELVIDQKETTWHLTFVALEGWLLMRKMEWKLLVSQTFNIHRFFWQTICSWDPLKNQCPQCFSKKPNMPWAIEAEAERDTPPSWSSKERPTTMWLAAQFSVGSFPAWEISREIVHSTMPI